MRSPVKNTGQLNANLVRSYNGKNDLAHFETLGLFFAALDPSVSHTFIYQLVNVKT